MKTEKKICLFCGKNDLYTVSSSQYRCVTCKRTFSHVKYAKEQEILNCFIHNISALQCATRLGINYATSKKAYHTLRLLLIEHSEALYAQHTDSFSQYDEYYYLPTTKREKNRYIFDAIGILGMLYGKRIHTLLLPDQFAHLKNAEENSLEQESYARFLTHHKVAHYKSFENDLVRFWSFLEIWMDHFKGIKKENFIYYLKEAEFKFNHTEKEQRLILETLWRKKFYM